jgi:hypothetical protein
VSAPQSITEPNSPITFKDRALPLIARGIKVIPLRPRTKIAFVPNWGEEATTSEAQVAIWDELYPNANCGCVAKAEAGSVWFFESDSDLVAQRIFEDTKQKLPKTFMVASSIGKKHLYWRANAASIEMGNLPQGFVRGGDWSARVHNEYVTSPLSIHPKTGLPYVTLSDSEIVEAPLWFIEWCKSQRISKNKPEETPRDVNGLIPHGYIHDQCVAVAGKFVSLGMSTEGVEEALVSWATSNCAEPLDLEHVRQVARSTDNWKRGNPLENIVLVGGKPVGSQKQPLPQNNEEALKWDEAQKAQQKIEGEKITQDLGITKVPYPKFPHFVMKGTSLFEGLVKPYCDVNCRHEEAMFMPGVVLFLNCLGTRVRIETKDNKNSLYLVMVGDAGAYIKSSCVESCIDYFCTTGLMAHADQGSQNADGQSLIFTAGSPEGLGIEMSRLNCHRAVLYYDELDTLVSKSGIDSSTLRTALCTMYESGKFANQIKDPKKSYSFAPGTYCTSMIACVPTQSFQDLWGKLNGKNTGMDSRTSFVMQPQQLKPRTPYVSVNTALGAARTRGLIERAIEKGTYPICDQKPLQDVLTRKENAFEIRDEIRAEKYALYFAIDLGLDEVDENCLERAIALVEYERAVKAYNPVSSPETKEAMVQSKITTLLEQQGGVMQVRDLIHSLTPYRRWGTTLWSSSYSGLIKNGQTREEGGGQKGDPKLIRLLHVEPR